MAFNYSTPHFGQTSSSSSAPFAAPSESSSVFAQITPSPFGRSNSSSFGGFQTANTSPFGSGFFGSTNSGFGVSNAPNSGFNFNSSTTPMFGVPNPFSAFGVQSSSSGQYYRQYALYVVYVVSCFCFRKKGFVLMFG
ncbi:hypothetical protein MIMGU_mgv1a016059mg [Erythranthe guttata]|uniref:Uncharacterized protein n=1 Tax=Erythranthe guttata TaxID=4155 RepID=A0A022PSM5_ERYGU|nr:hypothetical protein MIMGU_mgv1a016059mg [Erythranthe guttata]